MSNTDPRFKRIECWTDTRTRSKLYPVPESEKICDPSPIIKDKDIEKKTTIMIQDMDSIDCGLYWNTRGLNPVILNLADDCFPGGCVDLGSGAQEESLFRRTNLCETLNIKSYPIKNNELIYSKDVSVFKTSEHDGWTVVPAVTCAFITCPGIREPTLDWPNETYCLMDARLNESDVLILSEKIRNILRVSKSKGHDVPVLGAMGCGAWKNPSKHVAEIFKQVLHEKEFLYVFDVVTIAIKKSLGGVNNYDVFKSCFE